MKGCNGLVSSVCLTRACGTAERDAALAMIARGGKAARITLGADKGYDVASFITALRARPVTPHIATDRRVSKTAGCASPRSTAAPRVGSAMTSGHLLFCRICGEWHGVQGTMFRRVKWESMPSRPDALNHSYGLAQNRPLESKD
jgi:hypothetical protein